MADIEKLKALAEAVGGKPWAWWTSCSFLRLTVEGERDGEALSASVCADGVATIDGPEAVCEFIEVANPAAVLELIAELKELRGRAAYWKQRAKSAEGHLYAGDMKAAMRELHKRTAFAGTPWEDLSVSQHAQIQGAALAVVGAINSQRDRRLPADSREAAHD
ncbi:MAG TPA: hypothetical protein VL178_14190 [Pseudomonas sp.]|nr:hypothetical protein [Pseudomonas sp.]